MAEVEHNEVTTAGSAEMRNTRWRGKRDDPTPHTKMYLVWGCACLCIVILVGNLLLGYFRKSMPLPQGGVAKRVLDDSGYSAVAGWLQLVGTLSAGKTTSRMVLTKDLDDLPGEQVEMREVRYAPGAVDPVHRHNAALFVYVLEGTVVMQLRGHESVTLGPGQTFYESPQDVHIVGRNASLTKPARFMVFYVQRRHTLPMYPAH